jgi:hypothetical protein
MGVSKKLLLIGVAIGVVSLSCAPHIVMQAKSAGIAQGSTIGVLVDLPWGQSTKSDLASFMTAALMKNGYHIKNINPEDLIPQGIWGRICNDGDKRYAFLSAVAAMIENSGKMTGDKDMWSKLIQINEIKEASMRFGDLNTLVDEFIKRWDTEYIMFIIPKFSKLGLNPHEYMVKILRIKDRETVFVYYIKSNEDDFQSRIPDPASNNVMINYSARNVTEYKMIKFCSYIAGIIQ